MLQRQFAAALEIDTPMYRKIERGERRTKREQIIALAKKSSNGLRLWNQILSCLTELNAAKDLQNGNRFR
jgi:hypothetical protein